MGPKSVIWGAKFGDYGVDIDIVLDIVLSLWDTWATGAYAHIIILASQTTTRPCYMYIQQYTGLPVLSF